MAAATVEQATAGYVDFSWRPRSARTSLRPVLSISALPDSLDDLDRLIRQAPVLRPVDVTQLALGHHYLAVTTANTLTGSAPTAAAHLRQVADTLADAAHGRPEVASLLPGDRRPVVQLGNILRTARGLLAGQTVPTADRDAAQAVAQRLPGLIGTLHARAAAEVSTGRWTTPAH